MFDAPAFAEGQVVGGGEVRAVTYGSDAGLFVEFRMEHIHQEAESLAEGKAVYAQVPFVRIYVPGDKTKVVDRAVRMQPFGDAPADPVRFAAQWAAFKAGAVAEQSGTPLAQWATVTAQQVRDLNSVNVWTVEQLAMVPDTALDQIGHGGRVIRDMAIARVESAKDEQFSMQMAAQNADLQRQLDELRASIESSPEKRGPGRPRKEEE